MKNSGKTFLPSEPEVNERVVASADDIADADDECGKADKVFDAVGTNGYELILCAFKLFKKLTQPLARRKSENDPDEQRNHAVHQFKTAQ